MPLVLPPGSAHGRSQKFLLEGENPLGRLLIPEWPLCKPLKQVLGRKIQKFGVFCYKCILGHLGGGVAPFYLPATPMVCLLLCLLVGLLRTERCAVR